MLPSQPATDDSTSLHFGMTMWASALRSSFLPAQENSSVSQTPERHSLLPIPEGVVIPGSRFR